MLGLIGSRILGSIIRDKTGVGNDYVADAVGAVGDAGQAVGGAVADAGGSAWDVLSGERDWRRQQKLQKLAWEREDSAYQRMMKDLQAAGINPMMAGQLGGSPSSAPVARSHSAESVGRTVGLAGSILSGGVGAMKGLTELGLIKANTANQIANTASTVAQLPVGIAKDVALTALTNAQVPKAQADTALSIQHGKESRARTEQTGVRTGQMRAEMPRFHAEADYYKRYGRSAVLARENRNPWQSGMLVADQAGRGPFQNAVNSAAKVLEQSANRNLSTLQRKTKSYSSMSSGYYTRRR